MYSFYDNQRNNRTHIDSDDDDDEYGPMIDGIYAYPPSKQNQSQRHRYQQQQQQQQLNHEEKQLRKQRKYEREQAKLMELRQLPDFNPLKSYKTYFINRMTPLLIIFSLLEQVKQTVKYTIDSEADWRPTKSAIIQVEFIDNREKVSTVLLIEMVHLPKPDTRLFRFIQKLFAAILNPSNEILMWSDVKKELLAFLGYNLFSADLIRLMNGTDMQIEFKDWYNRTFAHDKDCYATFLTYDHQYCTCEHRPYKCINDKWSLQLAMAKTFGEFLDKKLRRSRWSVGLDPRLDPSYQPGKQLQQQQRQLQSKQYYHAKLTKYAVHDCLSVTKLAMVVQNEWTREQLSRYNQQQQQQHQHYYRHHYRY